MSPPSMPHEDETRQKYLVLDTLERLVKEVATLRERVESQGEDFRGRMDKQKDDTTRQFETLRREELEEMKINIALLMFKVGLWGGGAGIIGGALGSAIVSKFIH